MILGNNVRDNIKHDPKAWEFFFRFHIALDSKHEVERIFNFKVMIEEEIDN